MKDADPNAKKDIKETKDTAKKTAAKKPSKGLEDVVKMLEEEGE
jgi:hypothetical protein